MSHYIPSQLFVHSVALGTIGEVSWYSLRAGPSLIVSPHFQKQPTTVPSVKIFPTEVGSVLVWFLSVCDEIWLSALFVYGGLRLTFGVWLRTVTSSRIVVWQKLNEVQ